MDNMEWAEQWHYDVDASGEYNSPIELHQALTRVEARRLHQQERYPLDKQTRVTGSTALLQALKTGRDEVAKYLLDSGCNPDLPSKDGDSPLHIAVSTNNDGLVRLLLKCKANPYAINTYGQSILHKSVHSNHANNLLPILLQHTQENDHVNKQDIKGRSALRIASSNKMVHREMLDYDPLDNVKLLLQYGADPNLKCFKHLTPLHVATYGQFPSTVKVLLDSNADVDVRENEHCQTALHIACQRNSCDIVHMLVQKKSDLHTTDVFGNTLLHSVRNNHILQYLLKTKCFEQIEIKNQVGSTPLHVMYGPDLTDMIQSLVELNVDIYATNENGRSCLHTTCIGERQYINRLDVIKKLIDVGVNVLLKDKFGNTALDYITKDTESRKHLQEVMDNCTKNPGYKRTRTNTGSEEDMDSETENDNAIGGEEKKDDIDEK
jgi:hypothetical protein